MEKRNILSQIKLHRERCQKIEDFGSFWKKFGKLQSGIQYECKILNNGLDF